MKALAEPNTDNWLAMRQTGVGASDVSTIIGLNPWKQARELWHEKRGDVSGAASNTDAAKLGHWLEPAVLSCFQDRVGIAVRRYPCPLYQGSVSHHLCTPDAELEDGSCCEAKTSIGFAGTWSGYSEPPDMYFVQCQWQCHVMDVGMVHLALLVDGHKFYHYQIGRDQATIDDLVPAVDAFWESVQSGQVPEWNLDHPRVRQALQTVHADLHSDEVVTLSDKAIEDWLESERLKKQAKADDEKADKLRARAIAEIGDHFAGDLGDRRYIRRKRIQTSDRDYMDVRVVKKLNFPDL